MFDGRERGGGSGKKAGRGRNKKKKKYWFYTVKVERKTNPLLYIIVLPGQVLENFQNPGYATPRR